MEYLNTWNCDLKSYYGYHWNSDKLDKARDRMEKYFLRIKKMRCFYVFIKLRFFLRLKFADFLKYEKT